MLRNKLIVLALFACSLLGASTLRAEGDATPTFTGKGKITDAINGKLGAVFDIGGGVVMRFPRGLPVGESRIVTLEKARSALPGKLVEGGFRGVGPTVSFSGAFTTANQPIVLEIASKKDPAGKGHKLVLAMEIGTLCSAENKAFKLKNGLCSGIELHEAEYESGAMVAKLASTGGMRMQFGLVKAE